MKTNRWNWGHS